MKRSKRERILWIVIATLMISSMLIFTVMPFFSGQ